MTNLEIMAANTAQVLVDLNNSAIATLKEVIESKSFEQELLVDTVHGLVRIRIKQDNGENGYSVYMYNFRDQYEVTNQVVGEDELRTLFGKICIFKR